MADETQKPSEVKHINVKTGGANPRDAVRGSKDTADKAVFMLRIWGVIMGVKSFEDKKDGNLKYVFVGEFMAQNEAGALYSSEKMFCFKAMEDKFRAAYESGGERSIEFAYDISAVTDAKSSTGYSYLAKSVIPTVASDRLAALAEQIKDKPLASANTNLAPAPATETPAPAAPAAQGSKKGGK